ncbi:GNAT family N-acetyltransferase [bacterium]|nr:GNAT family N-acetyltransferase [bacterium]
MPYRLVTHEQTPRLAEQLTALSNLAFAEYEGAPAVDAEFTRWYARRPGSTPGLCVAALDGDEMVANVLVAVQELSLGGEFIPCGIVDTVATHPDHRRHGLAHQLMDMAHDLMRRQSVEAGVLYTNPANHPYHFYTRLGYITRAQAAMLTGSRPAPAGDCDVRPMAADEAATVRTLVNDKYAAYEGFARLDGDLWRWHRVDRPAALPVQVIVAERAGRTVGTAALAGVSVLLDGRQTQVTVISDAVYDGAACLRDLLAAASQERLMALHDVRAPEHEALQQAGFTSAVGEVAMVLPFTDRARDLLSRPPTPWYVMVESVVGV